MYTTTTTTTIIIIIIIIIIIVIICRAINTMHIEIFYAMHENFLVWWTRQLQELWHLETRCNNFYEQLCALADISNTNQ